MGESRERGRGAAHAATSDLITRLLQFVESGGPEVSRITISRITDATYQVNIEEHGADLIDEYQLAIGHLEDINAEGGSPPGTATGKSKGK